jgi:NADH:ubiquinone oxidoreductase subunit E
LLYLAQREHGYITEAAMTEIAGLLKLTPPQVYETATFYTMLNLKKVGTHHIQVCKSLMCALVGADTVIGWIKTKLGIAPGETTTDGLFTLTAVECLAACGTADDGRSMMIIMNADGREGRKILTDLRLGTSLLARPMWPESTR